MRRGVLSAAKNLEISAQMRPFASLRSKIRRGGVTLGVILLEALSERVSFLPAVLLNPIEVYEREHLVGTINHTHVVMLRPAGRALEVREGIVR